MERRMTPWEPTAVRQRRGPLVLSVYPEGDNVWAWDVHFKDGEYPDTEEDGFLLEAGHTDNLEDSKSRADAWVDAFSRAIARSKEG